MSEQLSTVDIVIIAIVICALVFAGTHEKHYRDRRGKILGIRLTAIEGRLGEVESILTEDRLT